MAVKILHAADFHMDSPFDGLGEEKALQRRAEQRELLEKLADIANGEKADILLLPGDLLDSSASYYETHDALVRAFESISAKIFIAPGNHDYYCAKSPYSFLEFPDNVHIFKSPIISHADLPELGCRIWGAGFTAPRCPSLMEGFSVEDTSVINIMLIHGELGGNSYNYISEEAIAGSGLDYLALGHVHTCSGVKYAGKTPYAYPGCIQGRGFDELGPKGILLGTVDKGECKMEFIPMGGRQYEIIKIDLTGRDDPYAALMDALPPRADRDIYRVIFTGEYGGELDIPALSARVSDKFYAVTIRGETWLPGDIWEASKEDSLKGLFLSRMRDKYDTADERGRLHIVDAVKYGLAALENREEWRP